MRLTALAVVILALGIVVGFALAGGSSGGPASAVPQCPGPSSQCATPTPTPVPTPTPAPPQHREDQITFLLANLGVNSNEPDFKSISEGRYVVELDASDYPASTTFRLEVGFRHFTSVPEAQLEGCVRLFDTSGTAVAGSEICWLFDGQQTVTERLRSNAFTLPPNPREYEIQGIALIELPLVSSFDVTVARIIVEWTE